MSEGMNAVRCPAGLIPQVVKLKTFEDLQRNVGREDAPAHIVGFQVGSLWTCWCDEDAGPMGLPFNRVVNGTRVFGTFVMARTADPKSPLVFGAMTDEQAAIIVRMVKGWHT